MSISQINLNLINDSNDADNPDVVVFQKNVGADFDEMAVAWRVIQNLGKGDHHPFTYAFAMQLSASDSYGNFTPKLDSDPGQSFSMIKDQSGDILTLTGESVNPSEVECRNDLELGAISSQIWRSGRVLSIKSNYPPKQKAVYRFLPKIWIGVVSQVEEGQVMKSAVISEVNTELDLLGVASADIIWQGGGPGPGATPYTFTLANIVRL